MILDTTLRKIEIVLGKTATTAVTASDGSKPVAQVLAALSGATNTKGFLVLLAR